ncbi:hypothetical protein BO85DRAFT_329764, partial [Aspergillus piperis CBS 112811]
VIKRSNLVPRSKALVADLLVQLYFSGVQREVPLIDQAEFLIEFYSYCLVDTPRYPSFKWPTIINLILAIGARYGSSNLGHPLTDSDMHEVYFTHARVLGLSESLMFNHSDLMNVQIEGLTCFYLLIVGEINR